MIIERESDLLFLMSKRYDDQLCIKCSSDDKYKIKIPRTVEPDSIKAFDAYHSNQGDKLVMCMALDDEFYYDSVNLDEYNTNPKSN